MDIRQLKCLIGVAEELNFGRAALRLGIAQSALSRQIQTLEDAIGVRLLVRNKRAAVSLTDAGAQFLAEARAAVDQFDHTLLTGRRLGRGELGKVNIGYVASATFCGVLPKLSVAFRRRWPETELSLREMDSARQIADLSGGAIDIGFFRPRPDQPPGIETLTLLEEAVMIALRPDHPLALADAPIRAADLAGSDFIVPQADDEAGFSRHTALIAGCGGFTARIAHNVRDFVSVLSLVGAGLGIAVVPASLCCVRPEGITYRPLADIVLSAPLLAAFRLGEKSPAVANFIRMIRERPLERIG